MAVWAVVQVGCIECGDDSTFIGAYGTKAEADNVVNAWQPPANVRTGKMHSPQRISFQIPNALINVSLGL